MTRIDLNADLGELPGEEGAALDAAIMPLLSSCNVACGGHAGNEETMRRTLAIAKAHGVAPGAHPSYPDREGFGRREVQIGNDALAASLAGQVTALIEAAAATGTALTHLKPHGALYHVAARDERVAATLATIASSHGLALVGPPTGALRAAAHAEDLAYLAEGFADRSYQADGTLTPRGRPGAVLTDHKAQARQALSLARGRPLDTPGGSVTLRVETLCLHGDTPGAIGAARAIRSALEADGIEIGAPHAR
ncbi:5-oxoprolinase subunit PxpA [Parvularcula dongshanensis]|uniref:UPF0271 protein n=1 Tax=Parvularcula dongshanensis TaxID=1173995 RepID=A0A840I169_9PROT|nr:UPF0271 protein [Parvularcula dongshanensis]